MPVPLKSIILFHYIKLKNMPLPLKSILKMFFVIFFPTVNAEFHYISTNVSSLSSTTNLRSQTIAYDEENNPFPDTYENDIFMYS